MKYLGNCADRFDWDSILEKYKQSEKNKNIFWDEIPDSTNIFDMIGKTWDRAGYVRRDKAIEWETFFKLDSDFIQQLGEELNATPWYVWISHIAPGKVFPWHIDDKPSGHGTTPRQGTDVRVTFIIQDPTPGAVSIVKNDNVYMAKKGDMFLWDNWSDWHCGMNLGFEHKWQLNFWGFRE